MKLEENRNGADEDLILINKYQKTGDIKYISRLFLKYSHLILGVCIKYLKEAELSKDLTMDVFEKLQKELKTKKVENFKSWLYVLTKNECLMYLRSKKKEIANLEEFEKNQLSDMDNTMYWHPYNEDQEGIVRMLVNRCLKKLVVEQRDTIQLFYLDKKSYQEISDLQGKEVKTIKSFLQNGRRNLKICIERRMKKMQTV